MKLNLFIIRQIRRLQNKIGKKEALEKLKIDRSTIFRWQTGERIATMTSLENVCTEIAKIFKEEYEELFMQGLYCVMQDHQKKDQT